MTNAAKQAEVAVIRLEGNIRMGDKVDKLRSAVEEKLSSGSNRIVIEMSRVSALDSSGIGILVRCLTLAKHKGGMVKLAALPEKASQSMLTTGILKLFETFPDEASAIASFQ
ncbi:MAG TPA: STAS domain-containing protein [Terriglobales bacterium]|nr:STAS domain-containing protein [Terriglobales bacterium]